MIKTIVLNLIAISFSAFAQTGPLRLETSHLEYQVQPGETKNIQFQVHLEKGYHAYLDKLQIKSESENNGFLVQLDTVEPIVEFFDKTDQKTKKGFKDESIIKALIETPKSWNGSAEKIPIDLKYQACNESVCTLPIHINFEITLENKMASSEQNPMMGAFKTFFSMDISKILEHGLLLTLLVVFIAGILTSFTPCIFPMIPITLAVLGHEHEKRNSLQNFLLSLFYVQGIAFTYSLLGVLAARTGALFGSALQNPWVLISIALIFFIMGLGMYGAFEMQPPRFIRKLTGHFGDKKGGSFTGAFISGVLAGVVASPCVGPILVGILTYVAKTQNIWLGFILLYTYAMGMGMLFLLLGFTHELRKYLPKSGNWMNFVKGVLGSLMIGVSLYYGYLGWNGFKVKTPSAEVELPKASHNNLQWKNYSEELIQQAQKNKKFVVIDFYADWCAACLELEERTFSAPEIEKRLQNMVLLKVDNTNETPESKLLIQKYGVIGLPTLIFINDKGEVQKSLTLNSFEKAEDFNLRLNKLGAP